MHKMTKTWGLWLIAILLVVITGCGMDNTTNSKVENHAAQQEQNTNSAAEQNGELKTAYPLTISDTSGQEYTFDAAPTKIVTLAPSETEILFAIGLDQEIVGVSDTDDYPEAAAAKPKMGGWEINVEAVLAADPDVVFTGDLIEEATIEALKGHGLKVFQSSPKTLNDVITNIETYGLITDHQQQAQQVIEQMRQEMSQVTEAVKSLTEDQKKRVYIEFSPGWTVGKGEFMDELVTLAGGVNVASDITGWSEINEENIIQADPEVILYSNYSVDENNNSIADLIKGRSGWDQVTAVKENKLVGLEDNLVSRPGPRVTQGLIAIAKAIYPELMQP